MKQDLPQVETPRRNWFAEVLGICFALLSAAVPVGSGLAFFLAPLAKKKSGGDQDDFLRIATLDNLPSDGTVQQYPVIKDMADAWNKFPKTPVGSIFLRKMEDGKVQALNAMCPHLGCYIQYEAAQKGYACHCHGAGFKLTGEKVVEDSKGERIDNVSPRGMDELQVEIRNNNEVWVRYQNFRPGITEKIPSA